MKMLKLPKSRLDFFAAVTQQFGEVHAPVQVEGGFAFRRLNRWSEARLDYQRTLLPPKKYFLPPEETLLRYRHPAGYEPCTDDLDRRLVLFGLHPCDIYALNLLDRVFGPPFADPYYMTRRRNIAIIGIDCMPDEHCFCSSMRADFVDRGFDLFLSDIGEDYFTLVGSARGDDMVLAAGPLFSPVSPVDVDQYKRRSAPSAARSVSTSRSATCPRSSKWSTKAASGRSSASAAWPAAVAAWSARAATASTSGIR